MSTYLNFAITTREEFKNWIQRKLGYPLVTIEITDDQLDDCINDAIEEFTKWCPQEQQYYAADLSEYDSVSGIQLPSNVAGIFSFDDDGTARSDGINTLFTAENTLWNASGGTWPFAGGGGSWIDYHIAMDNIKLTKYMTGKGYQFEYNSTTQYMTLYPDPVALSATTDSYIVLGTYVIRPEDQQYGESWVKRMGLAEAKITIGNIRSKFEGVQLLGGGTINTDIKQEGLAEKEALLQEIKDEYPAFGFWVG